MTLTRSKLLLVPVFCFSLLTVACGDDDSGPTAPTPEVTLTGSWTGTFTGDLVSGDGTLMLTQQGTSVSGDWSAPMPQLLIAQGAPDVPLTGPVTGTVSGTTAMLSLGFVEAFQVLLGGADCGIDVDVTSFSQSSLEGTYGTNDMCPPPINDEGTLSFSR